MVAAAAYRRRGVDEEFEDAGVSIESERSGRASRNVVKMQVGVAHRFGAACRCERNSLLQVRVDEQMAPDQKAGGVVGFETTPLLLLVELNHCRIAQMSFTLQDICYIGYALGGKYDSI